MGIKCKIYWSPRDFVGVVWYDYRETPEACTMCKWYSELRLLDSDPFKSNESETNLRKASDS